MPLPEQDVERVRDFCQARVPDHVLDQLRVEMDIGRGFLTILECRAPWREDFGPEWTRMPVARLRYVQRTGIWTLYYRDRNSRFHLYDLVGPSAKIDVLLKEIERDPTGIFWG